MPEVLVTAALSAGLIWTVAARRRSAGLPTELPRISAAVLAGWLAFLGTFTLGCDDVAGVSDWERCSSILGNPSLEWPSPWNLILPAFTGVVAGLTMWWLLGRLRRLF